MKSRMDKYDTIESREQSYNNQTITSRQQKNQKLYREVSKTSLDDFDVDSNMSILGDNSKNIDIDDVKDMLNKKYHLEEKKKIVKSEELEEMPKINLDETRDYDLTAVLEKVKANKEVDYEEERLKKVNSTQYDILKNLDIFKRDEEKEEEKAEVDEKKKDTEKELVNLINTINAKEQFAKELKEMEKSVALDPLDILSDLKGDDDNTRVMGALDLDKETEKEKIKQEIKEIKELMNIETTQDIDEEKGNDNHTITDLKLLSEVMTKEQKLKENKDDNKKDEKKVDVDKSFFTGSAQFNLTDFDDFSDLRENNSFIKLLLKILVVIIIILFIAACVIFARKFF